MALAPDDPKPALRCIVADRHVSHGLETVGDVSAVLAVLEPVAEGSVSLLGELLQRHGLRVHELVEHVCELGVFGRAACVDDVPERSRLWRWRLRVEAG